MTPKDTLKIASFDGGGPRSFSQLRIMQAIMHRVQWDKYPNEPNKVVLPCDYFDLIGGSDIGGLIAIMFVKLRMSVEDAIIELGDIVKSVYERGLQPSERTTKLKNHMESLLLKWGFLRNEKLENEETGGCVGLVLAALSLNSRDGVCLRTYPVVTDPPTGITVVEAVLATCASPSEFLPVSVGLGYEKLTYVSAGLGANNPIRQVIAEADFHFGGKSRIELLLSLGSGHPGTLSLSTDNNCNALDRLMRNLLLDCEKQAQQVQQYMKKDEIYFRFSVEQGMQKTHAFAEDLGWISAQTSGYISQPDTLIRIDKCVERMKSVQRANPPNEIGCVGERGQISSKSPPTKYAAQAQTGVGPLEGQPQSEQHTGGNEMKISEFMAIMYYLPYKFHMDKIFSVWKSLGPRGTTPRGFSGL